MKKVIIIGAGPAGITAGYELLKQSKEYEVTILEESPYIGGISRTEVYNGHRMDIGGHRFFSKSQEVNDWWNEIMPLQGAPAYDDDKLNRDVPLEKGGPDPAKVDRVMLNRSRVSHIYYKRKFFEYPVKMNADTIKNMGFGTTMQAGFSYLGSMVAKKPENTLENFYINQFGKKLYSMFFEGYTEKLWGRHPREIDPSWGAQRTKGLSITEIVKDATRKVFHRESKDVNTSLIGAFKYPKLGPGQLWEVAAEEFEKMGGSIHLNCQVIRINTNGNKVESVTCAVDGITIEEKADIIISSMPIKDLIIGMNNVPPNVTEVARRLPYRDFVTVGLLVPKLRISNTTYVRTLGNVIPDTWIYVQDIGVKMGRIQIFNNWSPYLLQNPEKTVWVGLEYFCNEGDRYWNMTDEEWIEFATKELVQMGILSESTKVLDAHKVAVKKAYPAYFDSYSRFDEVRTYLDGFENLYCVGRNGQHRYNNMDHSMITSFETVKNILSGEKDKSNIWNVNTEKEYHEETAEKKENKAEEKKATTAAPVPPVKEQPVVNVSETPGTVAEVSKAQATDVVEKTEEEITASVQAVPTPPVRRPIRRAPKQEQSVVQEPVVEAVPVVTDVPAQTMETITETPVEVPAPIVEEVVVPEAEIHESRSRSIWDDVAYAEATAEVKTAPIRFKSVEEAHAAVKGSLHEKKAEPEVVEATAVPEEVETVKEEKKEEKASEPKKTNRGRKKKTADVKEEVVKKEDSAEETVVQSEKEVEEKPQVAKKTGRGRKKKTAEAVDAIEETTNTEIVTEDVSTNEEIAEAPVTEEAVAEEAKVEVAEEAVAEEVKVEVAEETVAEEAKEEVAEETVAEEVKEEVAEETVAEEVKEEVEEEAVAEDVAKEPVTEEVVAEPVIEEVLPEAAKEEAVEEKTAENESAEEKKVEKKPATARKTSGSRRKKSTEVKEGNKVDEIPVVEERKISSRSTAGKTIAGRSSSRRVSDNRQYSNRRKVEPEKKTVSNVGKEATVGNIKGTVIKSNVIHKESEEHTKDSYGRNRRK